MRLTNVMMCIQRLAFGSCGEFELDHSGSTGLSTTVYYYHLDDKELSCLYS
jgi:hypothetical protein